MTTPERRYVTCEFHHASCVPGFGHFETAECVNPKHRFTDEEIVAGTFHGVFAPAWADGERLAAILREEATEDPKIHQTMWNTDRDRALLLHVADELDRLRAALIKITLSDSYGLHYPVIDIARRALGLDA